MKGIGSRGKVNSGVNPSSKPSRSHTSPGRKRKNAKQVKLTPLYDPSLQRIKVDEYLDALAAGHNYPFADFVVYISHWEPTLRNIQRGKRNLFVDKLPNHSVELLNGSPKVPPIMDQNALKVTLAFVDTTRDSRLSKLVLDILHNQQVNASFNICRLVRRPPRG